MKNEDHPRGATRQIRQAYTRNARLYDRLEWVVELLFYRRWRTQLWRNVNADHVLEIGIGTGKNIPHYPVATSVVGFDVTPAMLKQAIRRQTDQVTPVVADAQCSPFPANSFPVAVATFVFCSVPEAITGFREVKRVLRPGGRLLLLEHQRSKYRAVNLLLDLLNPFTRRLTGVNINRPTVSNVEDVGFRIISVTNLDPLGIFKYIEAQKPT